MTEILHRILTKVTRAEQHIQDFQLGRSAFFATNPYEIIVKENIELGKRGYFLAKMGRPPATLAAIASDVIQNLSGALDQLAYQLVLRPCSGAKPEWKVHFPIVGGAAYYKSTRGGVIKGVGQDVIDAIDATEPYKGGNGHNLWVMKQLRNSDQHELLVTTDAYSSAIDISGRLQASFREHGFEFPGRLQLIPANREPLKVGDCLFLEPLDGKVNHETKFSFDISFYEPGVIEGESALKTLKELSDLVGGVIRRFEPFFR